MPHGSARGGNIYLVKSYAQAFHISFTRLQKLTVHAYEKIAFEKPQNMQVSRIR